MGSRAATALGFREDEKGRPGRSGWLKGLFGRKRKREGGAEDGDEEEAELVSMNFLFAGGNEAGQTSLLL